MGSCEWNPQYFVIKKQDDCIVCIEKVDLSMLNYRLEDVGAGRKAYWDVEEIGNASCFRNYEKYDKIITESEEKV